MGGALIKGVCKAIDPADTVIYDTDGGKTRALSSSCGCTKADSLEEGLDAQFLVLAVKPQIIREVQRQINPYLKRNSDRGQRQVVISIAAGITLKTLSQIPQEEGLSLPIVRMLPNTPCEVGKGLILCCPGPRVLPEDIREINSLFSDCGVIENTDEHTIDVASRVSGCVPAFAYMFIEALADGAVRCGVPRDKAIKYAAISVGGSAEMVLRTGRHPEELKDAVCSPGGSTIVGVSRLENGGFRAAAANAVYYANEKNKELGK